MCYDYILSLPLPPPQKKKNIVDNLSKFINVLNDIDPDLLLMHTQS